MRSEYGVQWAGEADAVLAVVRVVAVEFADEVERLADEPARLAVIADPSDGQPVAYAFGWYNYVVTVAVRLTDRMGILYVDRVTVESSVGGLNPFG